MRDRDILEVITAVGILLGGIGGLLAGIGTIAQKLQSRREENEPSDDKRPESAVRTRARESGTRKWLWISRLGVILILAGGGLFSYSWWKWEKLPIHAQLTYQAWKSLGDGEYEKAITYADKCVEEFIGTAGRRQARLELERASHPPIGEASPEEEKVIHRQGLLNDVAACLYIKGNASEKLGKKEQAKQAYAEAAKLTYGRCWDPKGWFWSPAEVAGDRLERLK